MPCVKQTDKTMANAFYLSMLVIVMLRIRNVSSINVQGVGLNGTLTLGYSLSWQRGWIVGPKAGSAIILGINEIYRRQLLPGYDIDWVFRDDLCEPLRGIQMTVDMWAEVDDLDGIIGPGCSIVCQPMSLLAAAWGIPIISWGCSSSLLSDKTIHPTFSRLEGTWLARVPVYDRLADIFGWKRIAFIITPVDVFRLTSVAIMNKMEQEGKKVNLFIVKSTVRGDAIDHEALHALGEVMSSIKDQYRIFIIMTYAPDLRNVLITAMDHGMLNGEYVFLTNEFSIEIGLEQTYRPEADPVIFNGLMAVGVQQPSGPDYDIFRQQVIDSFQDPRFDHLPHIGPSAQLEDVHVYAGYIYDSVLQWAYGVNKTLEEGYPPDDGFRVTHNIFNLTFPGIAGTIAIDDVGDRKPDLRIAILQDNYEMLTLMEWSAVDKQMKKAYKSEQAADWSGIRWYGNSSGVPSDSPKCGWYQEKCESSGKEGGVNLIGILVTLIIIIVVVIIVSIVIFRKYKYESDLKEIDSIMINSDDIMFGNNSTFKADSVIDVNVLRYIPGPDEQGDTNVRLATYHGNRVIARMLDNAAAIDLHDRRVLVDLKAIRDLFHENINRFVGICVDISSPCIIMAYEQRGSLQDILKDDDNLSADFKVSFILDVACGMWYLHQSPVQYHGHLSSAKCIIDQRWTVKITGHGLRYVKKLAEAGDKNIKTVNSSKLLWTAPEIFRDPENRHPSFLQKADVFSFSIIGQEVFLNDEPYADNDSDPDDIIEKVKEGSNPAFRPALSIDRCPQVWIDLFHSCWEENPEARPDFSKILFSINSTYKHKNLDLVDLMVKRLEKYTNKLEDRVADRSRNIEQEKSKVEVLLKELLPHSVAQQLIVGQVVQPETFDSITVLFSDIVGFTRISSRASPIEVVVMLNNMYTAFDDISQSHDVYKVATIGDAYMGASGVPIRNGDRHAIEICSMAVQLLQNLNVEIPHLPGENLHMRIGVHTGSCVAGVVGAKMPRYLLFGETINFANKMESSGESMKIHISDTTKELLKNDDMFDITLRGELNKKVNETIKTYWLCSKSQVQN